MSKIMLCVVAVLVCLVGCTPMKNSKTADTARAHQTCTQTSHGEDCHLDSEKQFADCMRTNSPTMGSSGADAYCRCATDPDGVVVPSQYPAIPPTCYVAKTGAVTGGTVGGYGMPGYGPATVMPGRFPGYPGSAVIMMPDPTPVGVIAMESSGNGGHTVSVPGNAQPQPATSGSASQRDVDNLGRAVVAEHEAFCRRFPRDCVCRKDCKK